MSEKQREEVEKGSEDARLAAEKFEPIRQAQQAEHSELPATPKGRPPETVPHRALAPETLQRRAEPKGRYDIGGFLKTGRRRERRAGPRTRPNIRESRGAPLYNKRNPLESSGRISSELSRQKAERLATVREYIRAFQNRKELATLEKVWRRTRARYSHDPELRP